MIVGIRQKLLNNTKPVIRHGIQKYTVSMTENSKELPVYPQILDLSYRGKRKREYEKWHNKIKDLETVEEKLFELNMPRYYGWKSLILKEGHVPYNSLPQVQYITRTHVVKDSGLPAIYNNVATTEQLDSIVNEVKKPIEDCIAFEYSSRISKHKLNEDQLAEKDVMENSIANAIMYQINRILLNNLSSTVPHLIEAQTDLEPRVEAFWFVGGIEPIELLKKSRRGQAWMKEYVDDPVDRSVQYLGSPVLQLRHDLPLQEIMSLSESENPALDVPQFKYDPRVLGYYLQRRHGTTIPGFWPGDACAFGFLSFHNRGYMHTRPNTSNDENEALTTQAILACYSWLLSQACYQGFSTFHDVTYPLVNQAVITNGQLWSFYIYQLNTTLVHSENVDLNPRRNLCWTTDPMKLFDKIEGERVYGLNEEVLCNLIKFYMNIPQEKVGIEMKPYLGKCEKVIADIKHDERRDWLERQYKHLVTNRLRHRLTPQIYHWHKIYMIDNKTRPMEKKRYPWEFGINVFRRRLDEHTPRYIPRRMRANPKKRSVGRWEKTYYPGQK